MFTIWLLIRIAARVAEKGNLSHEFMVLGYVANLRDDS